MKKFLLSSFFIIICISAISNSYAQVTVSGALAGNGSYTTLSAAFTAINGSAQTNAVITISITGNTSEPVTGAVLNSGTWTSITISPNGGASRTISANVNAGFPLIDFNGTDNVTIDGLNSGSNSLTISNTSTSSTSGTSTIRINNDATNNKIKNCTVLGSSTMDATTTGGNILIGPSASSTGNDNILIENCNIGPAGSNLPSKAIFSRSATSPAFSNSNDTVRNCNIYDFFSSGTSSSAITLVNFTDNFVIKDNKFYQTSARTQTTSAQHSVLWLENSQVVATVISGNTIGAASSGGSGTYSLIGTASTVFNVIYIFTGATQVTSIQGNTISKISFTGSMSGSPLALVRVGNGQANIGTQTSNTFGSMSDTGNIAYSSTSSSNSDIYGIIGTGDGLNCSNNSIGGISMSNSGSCLFYGMRISNQFLTGFSIQNNIIGGSVENSINNKSTGTNASTIGIYEGADVGGDITGNTVRNVTSAGGTGTGGSASVIGIDVIPNSGNHTISQNTIYNLKNTSSSAIQVNGIYFSRIGGSNVISRNLVHTLIASSNSSVINGILTNDGPTTFKNNMIQLGLDTSGNSITNGLSINGINETGGTNDFYFNSVYIGGNPVSGSSNTFAFSSSVTSNTRNYRNNIFYNARSNSGSTGKHYAVKVGGTAPNPAGLTINYNIYLANGSGGVFGFFNSADVANLPAWQTAVGQDANSINFNPQFINPNGSSSSVNLHINSEIPTIIEGNGTDIVSITDDFDGETRSILTPVDIGADAGVFKSITKPVGVSGALSGNGDYLTLSAAFTAINSAAQTSANILIKINGDITESSSGAVLNSGTWASLTIQPNGGGSRTVSANVNAGSPLIDLNGADNVTIDGLNSGGNSLAISNTSTSSSAGTSTIRFQTDATNNKITNCSVLGSATMVAGTNGGNIFFGANSSTTGNDNNVISFCDIGPAGSNLPTQCVLSAGSTANTTVYNSADTIRNCNIFNYFHASNSSAGVYLTTGTSNCFVKDNKLYQTAARTQTTGNTHIGIGLNNTSGVNFTISGNTIGFSASNGTGTYTLSGPGNLRFYPVYLNIGTVTASSIQANIIKNISMSGTAAAAGSTPSFAGINLQAGLAEVGTLSGNTLGSMTDTSSISFTSANSSNADIVGIYLGGTSNNTISNNSIGGITASNSSTGFIVIYCIRAGTGVSNTATIQNNTIGGTPLLSINNKTNQTNTRTVGIFSDNPAVSAANNIIRNLAAAGGTGTNSTASVSGITIVTSAANHVMSQNTIYNLSNSNNSAATVVNGIFLNAASSSIYKNLIHSLSINNTTASMHGIQTNGGSSSIYNNMIRMGLDSSGNGINIGGAIRGIYESSGTNSEYFNSVYVGGNPTSGSSNTFAFQSNATSVTRIFRNNIFFNARSNSGSTGKHYAVNVAGTAPNPSGLTINNNVYFANGTGGVFGFFNSADVANLAAWQTAVGQDANSYESNPQYINPNGSASAFDLHINPSVATAAESNGFDVVSITDDYDGQTRSTLTPVDIGADAGDFINLNNVNVSGAVSGNGGYTTLAAAFTAINSAVQTSASITITILNNTTETSSAVLNSGTWSGLLIKPNGAKTISGSLGGTPLIDFNGADNVTIDGINEIDVNSAPSTLTISNPSTSGVSNTSTIRFINDASNNIITRCTILGATQANNSGTITFSTGTLTGNDNNAVSYCNIGPSSGTPVKAIYSSGSASFPNSGDTIRNCNIYDYFRNTNSQPTAGIYLEGVTDIVIKDNKLYQTASRTPTATGSFHYGIYVSNTNGNNFTITGNTIGFASSSDTGYYTFSNTFSGDFKAIRLTASGSVASNISNNIIKNISISGRYNFYGIEIADGKVNVSGNEIGSQTETTNITFTSNLTNDIDFTMINVHGTKQVTCNDNMIGGVNCTNTSTGKITFYGIASDISSSGMLTCSNNTIGSSLANSIHLSQNNTNARMDGIYCFNTGVITGNTIRNFTNSYGTGTGQDASIGGIVFNTASDSNSISQNQIYNLKNTSASLATTVTGIYCNNTTANTVEKNLIQKLIVSSNSGIVNGIQANGGTSTYQNNMIQCGLDTSGNSMNNGAVINGISETGGTNNFYFNSVYLGGSPTSGSSNTFAFKSSVTTNTRNFRDNIFFNARSNSGSAGKHYAVNVAGTAPNPSGLTINNNIYLANGSGGVFGLFNSGDVLTLSAWQTAVGQDASSYESNPQFINPNGSTSAIDLHINPSVVTAVEGNGFDIVSITDDYDGQTRSTLTPVDIGADAGNFIAASVTVSNALIGSGVYSTLADAFNAINAGSQTASNINIVVSANTTEPTTGAVLNAGSWSSLTIKPSGTRTVTAAINAGLPLIDLNGADNVTIDGLNSGGNSLTISNTSTSASPGTSTVRFQTDAVNNKITNCSILGSSTASSANFGGNILFGANSSITGNDNNVVSYCDIGPAGSNLPSKGIFSRGTTASTALYNSGDTIRNCNIYDYFSTTQLSAGVYLFNGSTNFTIKDNKFCQTSARILANDVSHYAIRTGSNGQDYIISGNTIGFSSSSGTGTYTINCNLSFGNSSFYCIYLDQNSNAFSTVQNNIISNISMSGDFFSAPFQGIYVLNGEANITDNVIGSQSDTSSIKFSSSSSSSSDLACIVSYSAKPMNCSNNTVGGIFASNTNTGALFIYPMRASMSAGAVFTCQNNTIGGNVGNSIQIVSNNTSSRVNGIYCFTPAVITGNTIRNLTNASGILTGQDASIGGLVFNSASGSNTISQNSIYSLKNTSTSSATVVTGIYYSGSTSNLIEKNSIHTLITNSNTSSINGIHASGGTTTYQNNMIQLGLDTSGNSINSGCSIKGINETGGTNNFYFNSLYLGGNPSSGSSNTFAFNSSVTSNIRNFSDNIFYNARSNNGSTGKHYAVTVAGTAPNPSGLIINYNIYLANGNGGTLGLFNGSDAANLSAWKSAVGQDANSFESNPQYLNPNGSSSSVNLHINPSVATAVEGNGIDITTINEDYDGQARSGLTPVDIGADAGDFTPLSSTKTLNLTMLIQGFYDDNIDAMVSDTVRVYLRSSSSPYAVVDSAKAYMSSSGAGVFTFSNVSDGTPYYIQLKHRNLIETWSDSARSFVSSSLTFNFTTAAGKAYGDNMILKGTKYCAYNGDVNQDGTVDLTDLGLIDNDAYNFVGGYVDTDLNGDDFVDLTDLGIGDNNAYNFVNAIYPPVIKSP